MLTRALAAMSIVIAAGGAEAAPCYESSIVSPIPFMGNDGEIIKLSDGSLWEVKYEYEYMYEYYPSVIICPGKGKLGIKGRMLNVQMLNPGQSAPKGKKKEAAVPDVIESRIDGDFEGWEGDTIFKLMNGQVWQQTDGRYKYKYKYGPKVIIFRTGGGYQMQVDGVDGRIRVEQLK